MEKLFTSGSANGANPLKRWDGTQEPAAVEATRQQHKLIDQVWTIHAKYQGKTLPLVPTSPKPCWESDHKCGSTPSMGPSVIDG